MSVKEQLTCAAGLAVVLAMTAFFPVFQGGSWFWPSVGAVAVVVASGLATRRLGVPRPLQPIAALLLLAAYLLVVFAGSTLSYGLVPTGRTADFVRALVDQGGADVEQYGPPVPLRDGLRMLTAGGIGLIAVVVDLVAVVLERAAVAGLPLLTLLAVPSAVLPDGVAWGWFVLGTIGWMGLLLVEGSERVGRWGTPMRSALPGARPGGDDSSLGRVGRRIGFAAVSAAVLIPYATPGLDERLIGNGNGAGAGDGSGDGPRTAQTYNAITRLEGYLTKSQVPLFEYVTTDENPDYIRMTTLEKYSNGVWSSDTLNADPKEDRIADGVGAPNGESGRVRDFTTTVAFYNDALDVRWLPAPYGVRKVNVGRSWLWERRSQTVFSAAQTTKDLEGYKVEATRPLPDRTSLQAARPENVDGDVNAHYGQPITVNSYVRQLTESVVAGKASIYDKAVAIQDYFSKANGFVYDLQASRPAPGQDKLEGFLKGKHGFCEQYATAMAAMLRVAGVPSRVAVGFTSGSRHVDPKTKTAFYVVTTKEAHAWPEAWFAGTGWVRFEPTPGASQAVVPAYTSRAPANPTQPNPGPSASAQPSAGPTPTATLDPKTQRLLDEDARTEALGTPDDSGTGSMLLIAAPVAVAVVLVSPFLLTFLRRRQRWTHPTPLTAWDQLLDDAADVGLSWRASDSPRAAAARLGRTVALPAAAVEALGRIASSAERARYAPPGRAATEDLSRASHVVRRALHDQADLGVKVRAQLFPPSTVRWALSAVGGAIGRALDAVDDLISATTRPLRRRVTEH